MDRKTAKAINALSNKVNEMNQRLEEFLMANHMDNKANIEFLAMVTNTDLDVDDDSLEIPIDEPVEMDPFENDYIIGRPIDPFENDYTNEQPSEEPTNEETGETNDSPVENSDPIYPSESE